MKLLLIFCFFISTFGFSQKIIISTDKFIIKGLVERPKEVTFNDLLKAENVFIENLKITNHAGEFRKEYKNIKGVSLLSLFADVKISSPSPKELSEYYLVAKATDGYSVVWSWNELFNTELGNSFYLVIELDGKSQEENSERILLVATKDFKTG